MSETFTHRPVLLDECIQALAIRPEGIYLDGTLGRAGHSREIARRLTTGRLICVDRDQAALDAAQERLAAWMDRVTLVHSNFDQLSGILDELALAGADGMLFDLGVSSARSWMTAPGASPIWRTRRWTCGWTAIRGSAPPTWSTPGPRRNCGASCASTERSATLPPLPLPSSAAGGQAH